MSTTDLITDPDRFFEQESDDPRVLAPTAIVLLSAVLSAAAIYPLIRYAQQGLQGPVTNNIGIVTGIFLASGFLGPLVLWFVFTVIFHIVMRLVFGGEGTFTRTLVLVGWGYLPVVLSGTISLVTTFVALRSRPPVEVTTTQELTVLIQDLQAVPALQMANVIGITLTLWQGFIWVFALKHGYSMSLRKTALTVGAPFGLWLLYQVSTLL